MADREEFNNRILSKGLNILLACYGGAIIVITFFLLQEDTLFVGNLRVENFEEVVVAVCLFVATVLAGVCFFVTVAIETFKTDKT